MIDAHSEIRAYILEKVLPGEVPENLTDDTPLVTSAILDSLATVMLVAHLEDTYRIEIAAHEASVENLNTVKQIVTLVQGKLAKK